MEINTRAVFGNLSVRKVEEEPRTFEFVAATEGGVRTWMGQEFLDMDGVVLDRYTANPVLLDSHNRDEASAVIGKAELKIENRQLIAKATFATTDRAENVYKLVDGGFISALSVGFLPRSIEEVETGTDGEIDGRKISGPASIIRQWELYEISVVPVPADKDAIKRELENSLIIVKDVKMADEPETVVDEIVEEEAVEETAETSEEDQDAILALGRKLGLETLAKLAIIKGCTIDEARELFAVELEQVLTPVGTVEPVEITEKREEYTPLNKRDLIG